MSRLVDCRTNLEECDLEKSTNINVPFNIQRFNEVYKVREDMQIAPETLLFNLKDALNCSIGISSTEIRGDTLSIDIKHNCPQEEDTIHQISTQIANNISRGLETIKESATLIIREQEESILLEDIYEEEASIAKNCVLRTGDRYVVSPTRWCINDLREAFADKGIALELESPWNAARSWGEELEINETLLGSYLFYKLPPNKPLSAKICIEIFDDGIIDGHTFRSFHIPDEIRRAVRGKFSSDQHLIDWYLGHEDMNISRSGGACDHLTGMLKASKIIDPNWAWFADKDDNLVILEPQKFKEKLEDMGYKVRLNPYQIEIKETAVAEVAGIKCTLREHQIDPVCAWKQEVERVRNQQEYFSTQPDEEIYPLIHIVKREGELIRVPTRAEMELYQEEGEEVLKQATKAYQIINTIKSTKGPPVAGGYIKSPTGSGKTFMGMVILGTHGEIIVPEGFERPALQRSGTLRDDALRGKISQLKLQGKSVRQIIKVIEEDLRNIVLDLIDNDNTYLQVIEHINTEYDIPISRWFVYDSKKRGEERNASIE